MEAQKIMTPVTHDWAAELHETFRLFDPAGEGVIEMARVKASMLKLTPGLTEDLYARVMSDTKLENVDAINFAQFFLVASTIGVVLPRTESYDHNELMNIFATFDTAKSGYIDLNFFLQIMLEEGDTLSQAEGKELILHLQRFGCLHNEKVNYRKFISRVCSCNLSNVFSRV